ncbi:Ig-like and fibronectin type-III domain-containing protein 2 [Babylonia areolata]|uniref:Ig-like and fibronectin type-III domain-containing protein 2 n=1 Tax=Babylonia areolata TaxID=304850 RepID=UPI003FCEFD36
MVWGLLALLLLAPVHGQGQPTIQTPDGQTWTSYVGGIVSISCQVNNLGTHKVNWVFLKHSTTIFHGNQLMVDDPRYMLMHPAESNVHSLQIMFAKEEDQGMYQCEIDGTTQAVTMGLVLQGAPATPDINAPREPLNRTGCCQQRNVSEACMPVCHPSSVPGNMSFNSVCASHLTDLIYCGSDGRNHGDCCARSGVPAKCLLFCSADEEEVAQVSLHHLSCLSFASAVISCFEYGGGLLPSTPQSFSVISVSRNGTYSLQVTWKPPRYNPSAVSGYRVFYKKAAESNFRATSVLNAATDTYSLAAEVSTLYTVYVIAVGHHGSSQPTDRIDIVVEDTSSPGHATDVLLCCQMRNVPAKCQTTLCHPRVWAHFNGTNMIECYAYMSDIFTCLAGERDNSGCCTANNVDGECVGMCSGHPPPFNKSLAACIPKLSIMEACVQTGLREQPRAPQGVVLSEVGAHEAVLMWLRPNATGDSPIDIYYVQLRRGNASASWETVAEVVGTYLKLTNLTETESYAVRVIAVTINGSSLPSAVVRFSTYPETSVAERPTVVHNITKCCEESGMPPLCSAGCDYHASMTGYYSGVLLQCYNFIGTVVTCAADGRDHTPCCRRRDVQEKCYDLCSHSTPGPLDFTYVDCIPDMTKIQQCYREGLEDLVRTPEGVEVTNLTSHTVTLQWMNPETGPQPDSYLVVYKNLNRNFTAQESTTRLMYIMQNLVPGSSYNVTVSSILNDTSSLPTPTITVFTPALGSELPFVPDPPTNTSRALWANRTHCCESSSISTACQAVCMNRPASNATDCSQENHNILACAADGQDHSLCCQENGLPAECLPLCSSHAPTNFSVRLAGCLADASLSIITSCFLSNSGLLPSVPYHFKARNLQGSRVILDWSSASNCDAVLDPCTYDVHYWEASNSDPSAYITRWNVSSPFSVSDLVPNKRYTFTVTARNSKGSGAPAPWVTLFFGDLVPSISIAQSPKRRIFNQHSTVYLTCDVFNLQGAPSFTWKLRNRTLPTRGRLLRLTNVGPRSEGNYSCTVTAGGVSVSAESYVNVRFKPMHTYFRTDSVPPNQGEEAVLACWFRGHPDTTDPASVWSKDGDPIPTTSRFSTTAKSRYHTGITAFKLKIALLKPSDYGLYRCDVSNQYGHANVSTKLIDPAKMPPPIVPTPKQKQNVSKCCQARGVVTTCLPLCSMDVSASEILENRDKYGICVLFMSEMIECAADGADHTLCCEDRVVPEPCLPYCRGEVPPLTSLLSSPYALMCMQETSIILDCMDRGYEKIPTAPRHLVASLIGNSIKVAWDLPSRNAENVTSYSIYYNFTGNPAYLTETVTSLVGREHVLQNVDPDHVYHIWMTAERYKFGRSQKSNIVSISSSGEVPMPPRDVKVFSVKGTTVVIGWNTPPSGSVTPEAYAVYYRPHNAIKEEKKLTKDTQIKLTDLKPYALYDVSVASRNMAGEGRRSDRISFTTGRKDASDPNAQKQSAEGLGGGQIAGIVLAVLVVTAVLILLAVLLYRSHEGRKKKITESVSFENPSYGNQQVHIDGLPDNNPYDNVMQPQTQPAEKDGDFTYARLQEDPVPAELSAKPAESDPANLPDTSRATPPATSTDPAGVKVDMVDSNGDAAKLEVSGGDGLRNESTT